jgi:outer membrane receptor protein involved in Fe transport
MTNSTDSGTRGSRIVSSRAAALVGSSLAAAFAAAAHAQDRGATPDSIETVVVTASRLTTGGFTAPTPTTIIGADVLEKSAEPTVFQAIVQLPSLMGSLSPQLGNGTTTSGQQGLSSFNLRGLGAIRTLTLLDGQRVVGANVTGVIDVNLLPQLLIQRVDVVTGGASSSYGSDAVSGVVNFVTDTHFTGFKANVEAGETNYADDRSAIIQVAVGRAFLDGRLHAEASGEFYKNNGIPQNPAGGTGPNGRSWFVSPAIQQLSIAATPAGAPEYTVISNAQTNQQSAYGLITAGPLAGTAFAADGSPYKYVTGPCVGSGYVCVGGESEGNITWSQTVDDPTTRTVGYGRISYDLGPKTELFATFNYGDVESTAVPNLGANKPASLTIQCSNAYLPAAIQQACTTNKITSFQFGTDNLNFPAVIKIDADRKEYRAVVGLNSEFDALRTKWTLQSYYEHGRNVTDINISNMTLLARYGAALDAVTGPNGTVVCRSAVAQANGCVPFDLFGNIPVSPTSWAYMTNYGNGPFQHSFQTEDAASIAFSGSPFRDWAGDVSVAFGGEWRREAYNVDGDPFGNGPGTATPYTAAYGNDGLESSLGGNWYAGNFHVGGGEYTVGEVFGELGVPLINGHGLGKADLNLAYRETNYSTSGNVDAWKIGGVWDTPLEGVRLRAVRSQDVRAPNLSELFAAPLQQNTFAVNRLNGSNTSTFLNTLGNPSLVPEIAANTEVGVVLRPTFAPGLNVSVDYYDVNISKAIFTPGIQQMVDLCQVSNIQQYCANVFLTGNAPGNGPNPNFVNLRPLNVSSIDGRGIDIEASYRVELSRISLPGALTLRGLATHVSNYFINPGVPGAPLQQWAGGNMGTGNFTNSTATPHWKSYITETWDWNQVSLSLTERIISSGVLNPEWVQCTSGCPVPTAQNPTINNNSMPGAFYLDVGGSYEMPRGLRAYFKIDNAFNHSPPPFGSVSLYDVFGRVYRVGLRFSPP